MDTNTRPPAPPVNGSRHVFAAPADGLLARVIPLRPRTDYPGVPLSGPQRPDVVGRTSRRRRAALVATLAGVAVTAAALTLGPWHGTRGPGAASPDATSAPSPRRDLTWTARQGVPFPVSATAGPLHRDGALATSFSHDDTGAALAAIWIVYQASSAPGPSIYRPALTRQVTGAHAATLAVSVAADYAASAAQSGITNGAALPGGDARFAAYRVSPLPAGNRQVQVYERAPDAAGMPAVYTFTVATTWVDGDWKVVAPASGAWNTAFVQVDDVPTAAVALAGAR